MLRNAPIIAAALVGFLVGNLVSEILKPYCPVRNKEQPTVTCACTCPEKPQEPKLPEATCPPCESCAKCTPSPPVPVPVQQQPSSPTHKLYDKLRADGLRKWKAFLDEDALLGFEKAHIVESVCTRVEDGEERQMCRKRGRWIGEAFLKHFSTQKLTTHAARVAQNSTQQKFFMVPRITISHGQVVGWDAGEGASNHVELPKLGYLVAIAMGMARQGLLTYNTTADIVLSLADRCEEGNYGYPVSFVTGSRDCPPVVPLNGIHLQQMTGFLPKKEMKPYDKLKNKVYFRASPYNDHRWMVFLTSATGALPWLDAQAFLRGYQEPKLDMCNELVQMLDNLKVPFLDGSVPLKHNLFNGTRGNPELCLETQKYGPRVPFDTVLEHKYHLVIDGFSSCFRLIGVLLSPGVPLLVQQTASFMSYQRDLVPYVHYLPIDHDLKNMLVDLKNTYEWAEANPEVTRSIAEESTRFAKLHAGPRAQSVDWALYYAFLVHLHVPESEDPEAGKFVKIRPKKEACSSEDAFFAEDHYPFIPQLQSHHRKQMFEIACKEVLGLARAGTG